MKRKRKGKSRLGRKEQLLVLTGCLLLAFLALIALPQRVASEPQREVNDMEMRELLSEAADSYMLASTTAERQAAAREMRVIRARQRSSNQTPSILSAQQSLDFLRILLIITIFGIGVRLGILALRELRLQIAQKA